jgi:hypothetical protein
VESPWRIVGPQGPSSNGSLVMARNAPVRAVPVTGRAATTALIICGRWRDRHPWSTVWGVVQTPCATVGGRPSAPKPHGPSACPAGGWVGMGCAGVVIAALPVIGRCLNGGRNDQTPRISGCPTRLSRSLLAATKPCGRPDSRSQRGWLTMTGLSRRWCGRSTAGNRQKAMQRATESVSGCARGCGVRSPSCRVPPQRCGV